MTRNNAAGTNFGTLIAAGAIFTGAAADFNTTQDEFDAALDLRDAALLDEINAELEAAAEESFPVLQIPRFDTLISAEDYESGAYDDDARQAEAWAEGAWLRHAESQGWEEAMMEERYRVLGY